VFCVKFSGDATYVLSGSDDTNIRLWKAKASEQLGVVGILPLLFLNLLSVLDSFHVQPCCKSHVFSLPGDLTLSDLFLFVSKD